SGTGVDRPDVARSITPAAGRSGFELLAEWKSSGQGRPEVRILAVGDAGRVGELQVPGNRPSSGVEPLPAELAQVRLEPGSMQGNVDRFVVAGQSILEVEFPPEVTASSLAGLQIEAAASRPGAIAISSVPPERAGDMRDALEIRGVAVSVPRTGGVRLRIMADN